MAKNKPRAAPVSNPNRQQKKHDHPSAQATRLRVSAKGGLSDAEIRRLGARLIDSDDDGPNDGDRDEFGLAGGLDEDLDSDGVFNSEDERKWGQVVNPIAFRKQQPGTRAAPVPPRKSVTFAASVSASSEGAGSSASGSADDEDQEEVTDAESDDGAEEVQSDGSGEDSSHSEAGSDDDDDSEQEATEDDDDEEGVDVLDLMDAQLHKQQREQQQAAEKQKQQRLSLKGAAPTSVTPEQHATLMAALASMDGGAVSAAGAALGSGSSSTRRPGSGPVRVPEVAPGAGAGVAESEWAVTPSGAKAVAPSRKGPGAAGAGEPGGGVGLAALLAPLGSDASFAVLRKRLSGVPGAAAAAGVAQARRPGGHGGGVSGTAAVSSALLKPLAPPPSHAAAVKAERTEAYAETRRDVTGKYQTLVQINRQAPTLSFSAEATLNAPGRIAPSSHALADRHTPANEFEAAVAAALSASGMGAVPGRGVAGATGGLTGDKAVLAAETAELAAAAAAEGDDLPVTEHSAERQAARAAQLARLRALMFYDEQKARRQNKIKSKAYRALKKRADRRKGDAEAQALEERGDADASAALEEARARLAAKERMTLRHRAGKGIGGSKWIKRVLARGGGGGQDAGTREALTAHLRAAAELQARMKQVSIPVTANTGRGEGGALGAPKDDDDDDGDDEDEEGSEPLSDADLLARARLEILASLEEDDEEETGKSGGEDGGVATTSVPDDEDVWEARPAKRPAPGAAAAKSGLGAMRFMQSAASRARETARAEALALVKRLEADEAKLRQREAAVASNSSAGAAAPRPTAATAAGGHWATSDDEGSGGSSVEDARDSGDAESATADSELGDAAVDESDGEGAGAAPEPAVVRRSMRAAKADLAAAAATAKAATSAGRRLYGAPQKGSDAAAVGKRKRGAAETRAQQQQRLPRSAENGENALHDLLVAPSGSLDRSSAQGDAKKASSINSKGLQLQPVPPARNAWLSQGGPALTGAASSRDAPSSSSDGGAAAGAAEPNPWLANAFSSSEVGPAALTVGRHKATQRAAAAAAAAAGDAVLLDVSASLSHLQAQQQQQQKQHGRQEQEAALRGVSSKRGRSAADAAAPASAADLTQTELLQRAFANGGAASEADLAEDKAAEAEALVKEARALDAAAAAATRPKYSRLPRVGSAGDAAGDAAAAAPGWGSWAGEGAGTPDEQAAQGAAAKRARAHGRSTAAVGAPQSRLAASLAQQQQQPASAGGGGGGQAQHPAPPRAAGSGAPLPRAFVGSRKDATLSTVLVSERVDTKLGAHLAAAPPRPYGSAGQYERALRQPLGPEWNALAATKELTAPEWTTRAGLIIQPIRPGKARASGATGEGGDGGAAGGDHHERGGGGPPPGPALASIHRSAVAVAGRGSNKKRAR